LELEGEEAGGFLDILRRITGAKAPSLSKMELLKKEKEDLIIDHSTVPSLDSTEAIHEISQPHSDQEIISPQVEQSDIIQSDANSIGFEKEHKEEMITQDVVEARVEDRDHGSFEVTQELHPPEIPATSEILQILKKTESAVNKILTSEKVKEESIDPIEDIASFFREPRHKSPLEELLDKDGNIREDLGEPIKAPERTKKNMVFETVTEVEKPLDHQTEAFLKKFDTKDALEILDSSQKDKEESKDTTEKEFQSISQLSKQKGTISKEEYQTEAERRAAIEKERAERRRRLWELTRGF
jgi:hypothetical protein